MTDPAYLRLGLPPKASRLAVVRAAIRALHPDTLAVRSFREARKRFYRDMLDQHAARQTPAEPRSG
ncbi:hypothetical protein [Roseicitreum antarcticum]|uniref:Uncharacterized protein n=1 Tax=Roseicitreum antarcticum TaxID=564137 RepID=A0A1H3DRJ7_9RHOB|nr:hypothetical protein [Roseicitreum antarcticum]SDX69045.1 hypothetical protein SAMN04488238_11539 [Roseicitreum antarcticum]